MLTNNKKLLSRSIFAAVIGCIAIAGAAENPASAASDAYCSTYAAKAVAQHSVNVRNRCGFGGTRWKNDVGGHFLYCKIARKSVTQRETRIRNQKLAACRHGGGGGNAAPRRCKTKLTISHIARNEPAAKLGAGFGWVRAAKDNYGSKYSNWSNARSKRQWCKERANGSFKCFARAKPCKA